MSNHRTIRTLVERHQKQNPPTPAMRSIARNIVRVIGDTRISRFSGVTMTRYLEKRNTEGAAPATQLRELKHLRAILRAAGVDVNVPKHGLRETPRKHHLTREAAERLQEALRATFPYTADVVAVLLGTACRVRELLERAYEDVSEEDGAVVIWVPSPKERCGKPLVAVNGAAKAALRLVSRGFDRPFGREGASVCADYNYLRRSIRATCESLGMDPIHMHDLRRTFASWAFQAGHRLEQVSQVLGHSSLDTTRRWYAHLDVASRAKLAAEVTGE